MLQKLLVGFTKLLLGILMAMVLLSLASVAAARYFMAKLTALPDKPVFANEQASEAQPSAASPVSTAATPATNPAPEAKEELPPGAYEATVVQPIGLVLREGPGITFSQMGGIEYNETVIVIGESQDKEWLNIRLPGSGQEGWVKAGNTRQKD